MKDPGAPISEDEWLLRRVHLDCFDATKPPKINLYAFKPQVKGIYPDTSGISFYRQSCIQHIEDVLAKTDEAKRPKYGIVRLPLSLLSDHRLEVALEADNDPPIVLGHVVMPAINSIIYSKDKDSILPIMKLLSDYVNEHEEFLCVPTQPAS